MVFPSLPLYHLDPTPNWAQQQPNQQHPVVIPTQNPQVPPPPPPPPMAAGAVGGGGGSTRAGSMADRARLAKMSQPEAALKCPRCESTNTKFCYYNNYSLSQPRHFCKACRRYWTRGGALRNVPVGGGCRRKNKRSNKTKSKSPMITPTTKEAALLASASASASASATNNSSSSFCPSHQYHHLPSHQYSNDVVSGGISGLQFGATYNIGNGGSISMLSNNAFVPSLPHHQQFPTLFTNLELEASSMQLLHDDQFQPSRSSSSTLLYSGLTGLTHDHHHLTTTIKMEQNILGHSANNAQNFLVANSDNAWNLNTIPTFITSSASTTHLL